MKGCGRQNRNCGLYLSFFPSYKPKGITFSDLTFLPSKLTGKPVSLDKCVNCSTGWEEHRNCQARSRGKAAPRRGQQEAEHGRPPGRRSGPGPGPQRERLKARPRPRQAPPLASRGRGGTGGRETLAGRAAAGRRSEARALALELSLEAV